MISVYFQGKPFDIMVIQLYAQQLMPKKLKLNGSMMASLVAEMVKHLPAWWETWVRSLGQEDALEKEIATHSSILAWRIPWPEEPGRLQSIGLVRVGHN